MRKVLVEKYKKHDYVDSLGNFIWLDKYGEIIRSEDEFGNSLVLRGFKGTQYLETGYVYAPYIPMIEYGNDIPRMTLTEEFIEASNVIHRKTTRGASANFIVCAPEVADVFRIAANVGFPA